jgi:C_GCAxxG_C_C family probable redox protein
MADYAALKEKVDELAERVWDIEGITARVNKMAREGIPKKKLDPKTMLANKEEILNRVQRRAEEYNFILKNCARGTALALMEEFGQGNMEIIKALTPFPGVGGTGNMCGGVTGSLINFGLYFGSDDPLDVSIMEDPVKSPMVISQRFMAKFKETVGYLYCADIIEKVTMGHRLNIGQSAVDMATFAEEKGFEKCGLVPGTGARIAAGIIIDSMK